MFKGAKQKCYLVGIVVFVLLFLFKPGFLESQDNAIGDIAGHIYYRDGTTPLEGAVIKFRNIHTDKTYDSSTSDTLGLFKVEGIEKGLYVYGVESHLGDFNSQGFLGLKIRENETARISIALAPFEKKLAESIQEFYEEKKVEGEALVGKIADYNPGTKVAEIFMVKGLLQVDDHIHTVGNITDFYQDLKVLKIENNPIDRVFVGQKAYIELNQIAQVDDSVYVVDNKGFLAFFTTPGGIASVIAGSGAVIYGIKRVSDKTNAISPFKR